MPAGLIPLLLVTLLMVGFILDGYKPRPSWSWGKGGQGGPISLLSRWVLSCYIVVLTLVLLPEIKEQVPKSLPVYLLFGLVPMLIVLGILDAPSSQRRQSSGKYPPALSGGEKKALRRERKKQRQRQTQARHGG
jgi:hypothetical protein